MEAIEKKCPYSVGLVQMKLCVHCFLHLSYSTFELNFSWKSSGNPPKLVSQFEKIDVEL